MGYIWSRGAIGIVSGTAFRYFASAYERTLIRSSIYRYTGTGSLSAYVSNTNMDLFSGRHMYSGISGCVSSVGTFFSVIP